MSTKINFKRKIGSVCSLFFRNNFPKYTVLAFIASLGFFFSSCKSGGNEVTVQESADESLLRITKEQFEGADMSIGPLTDTIFHHFVTGTGFVDVPEQNKMVLGSYFGGKISEIFVVTGQEVNKGAQLFSIDNPDFLNIQQEYLETRSLTNNLFSVYERQKKLAEENVSSQREFLQAESEYKMAATRLKTAEEKLRLMQILPEGLNAENLSSRLIIRAPFAASVSKIMVIKGQWLNPDVQAIELINPGVLLARLEVFEKDLSYIETGQLVLLQLPDRPDLTFDGRISNISKQIDKEKRTTGIIVQFQAKERLLFPGMYLTGNIVVEDFKVKCIEEDAVVEIDGKFFGLALVDESENEYHFKKTEVSPGMTMHGYTEIRNSEVIPAGTRFLTKGAFQLLQADE